MARNGRTSRFESEDTNLHDFFLSEVSPVQLSDKKRVIHNKLRYQNKREESATKNVEQMNDHFV